MPATLTRIDDDQEEDARLERYGNWQGASDDDELTPEQRILEARIAKVQALGGELVKLRREAMDARAQSGIEMDWIEDEEYYNAIDKANPEGETNVGKPVSAEGGPIGIPDQAKAANRSSVFIPITRAFVDTAHAAIADMMLPLDDWPWDMKPTPIPSMGNKPPSAMVPAQGPATAPMSGMGGSQGMSGPQPGMAMVAAEMQGMVQPPTQAAGIMANPAAAAEGSETERSPAEVACEKAKKRIQDWMIQCQYHAEFRKILFNACRLGTGILKGPVASLRVGQKVSRGPDGKVVVERVEDDAPASYSIDPRNFFPDPACGEDVQRGSYTWEFDTISARLVEEMLADPSYIEDQVNKVLDQGPLKLGEKAPESPAGTMLERSLVGQTYPVWYFYGMVDRETLEAAGINPSFMDPKRRSCAAIVTIINDEVVKCALSPLESGGFPYDIMPWQRIAGMIWGKGVARQMRTPQRVLNAAWRAMLDNAGFAAGAFWAIRDEWIVPMDGARTLTPRKGFYMTAEAPDNAKLQDALMFHQLDMHIAEFRTLIEIALKSAEDSTGLPMLLQGQQGSAPDLVGVVTILNNNGSRVLRRIARQADDYVTERQVTRYYHWLLNNTDYEDEKGDYQIDASGSPALVEREMAGQALVNMAALLEADPDVHKGRLHQEMLKAQRVDPKRIFMTDAEKRERDAQPVPPSEKIQVAQLHEEAETNRTVMKLNAQGEQQQEDRAVTIASLEQTLHGMLAQIAANREAITEKNKTEIWKTVATLRAQLQMDRDGHAEAAAQALAEPKGRAENGKAFTQ